MPLVDSTNEDIKTPINLSTQPLISHATPPMLARLVRRRRFLLLLGLLLLIPVAVLYFFLNSPSSPAARVFSVRSQGLAERHGAPAHSGNAAMSQAKAAAEVKFIPMQPNTHVHIFYYSWYGSINVDGQYVHWKHARLPHWNQALARRYSRAEHFPPEDLAANFYPKLGPYSSTDSTIFHEHFKQIRKIGVGVVVLSWYPPHMADDAGVPREHDTRRILDYAAEHMLKVAFHIEPYKDRHVSNIRRHLLHMVNSLYLNHTAYYKINGKPVFYMYDSYNIKPNQWSRLLGRSGDLSVRGTPLDGYFIGLFHRTGDCHRLADGGFNGAYSYFAVDGFTDGSRAANWPSMVSDCRSRGLEFIPAIGPGYDDSVVRPWNEDNIRPRVNGVYYRQMFEKFMKSGARYLSITSYNEWHEGTQIEPAIPKKNKFRTYKDYRPNPPDFYLHLTNHMVQRFSAKKNPKK